MKTYHIKTVVDANGSVLLSDLPPNKEVEIVILDPEETSISEDLQHWLDDIRARHPFINMDKEEVLRVLRETRESVWAERHEG